MSEYNSDGQLYSDAIISRKERAVIAAMRSGATVEVRKHGLQSEEEVEHYARLFQEFDSVFNEPSYYESEGSTWFKKEMDKVELTLFLDTKKVTPPASNE